MGIGMDMLLLLRCAYLLFFWCRFSAHARTTRRQYQKKSAAAESSGGGGGSGSGADKKRKRDGGGRDEDGGLSSAYRFRGLTDGGRKGGKPSHHAFKSKAKYRRR